MSRRKPPFIFSPDEWVKTFSRMVAGYRKKDQAQVFRDEMERMADPCENLGGEHPWPERDGIYAVRLRGRTSSGNYAGQEYYCHNGQWWKRKQSPWSDKPDSQLRYTIKLATAGQMCLTNREEAHFMGVPLKWLSRQGQEMQRLRRYWREDCNVVTRARL